ncbi:CD9 antigen isoform X1 [Anopheles gambiae]|uniref:Tetraspanin n=1 Tax=Anopheles coluzzii TaxID=1518534 RepID=A0A6E8VRV8_ANOCL|nr:CD9 antigen isoform X1 [Anopheles coluzzii]XP_308575.5 CD9 antigen isoform X1 [Anopheles gambiae]
MRLSARIKCFKYLVYAYVILISICGGAQLVIGAFLLWTHKQYAPIVKNQFWEPFAVLIGLGIISQALCYLGWTSTSRKQRCYLGLFCAFLVLFIVILFLVSGWSVATKAHLIVPAEVAIETSFTEFLAKDNTNDQTHIWNRLQRDFRCCGYNGIHDYKKNKQMGFPWSCYDPIDTKVFNTGCMHVFVKSIEMNMIRVAVVAVASALIQSLGIFCAIQLTMLLRRPTLMLPNGDNNHSVRVKRTRELTPLSPVTIGNPTPHSSSKPPIPLKPVVPRVEQPVMKSSH